MVSLFVTSFRMRWAMSEDSSLPCRPLNLQTNHATLTKPMLVMVKTPDSPSLLSPASSKESRRFSEWVLATDSEAWFRDGGSGTPARVYYLNSSNLLACSDLLKILSLCTCSLSLGLCSFLKLPDYHPLSHQRWRRHCKPNPSWELWRLPGYLIVEKKGR